MAPTVGQSVHYFTREAAKQQNGAGEGPYAAVVTQVFTDDCVNLFVMPPFAEPFDSGSVLRQDVAPVGSLSWWNPGYVGGPLSMADLRAAIL